MPVAMRGAVLAGVLLLAATLPIIAAAADQHAPAAAGDLSAAVTDTALGWPETPPTGDGVDPDFECDWRNLAYTYAKQLQPTRGSMRSVFDALQLATLCGVTPPADDRTSSFGTAPPPTFPDPDVAAPAGPSVYVDPNTGSDSNPGTLASPFKTIEHAVEYVRAHGPGGTVSLRAGTYYLQRTLALTTADSDLTIQNYNGEEAIISGGIPLKTQWEAYNVNGTGPTWIVEQNQNAVYGTTAPPFSQTNTWQECEASCQANNATCDVWTWHDKNQGSYALDCYHRSDGLWNLVPQSGHVSGRSIMPPNVYVADLSGQGVTDIPGLQVNSKRGVRARYPNSDPETDIFPAGWITSATSWLPPVAPKEPVKWVTDDTPVRNESFMFLQYMVGAYGNCSVYEPPTSYWCSEHPSGGGAFAFRIPSGLTYTAQQLPNAPYANPQGAVLDVWRPAHWANWLMELDTYDAAKGTIGWTKGGFQGARGSNTGAEWYIQNVFEELDAPNEYFYNATTQKLYYFNNATGPPLADTQFVATNLQTLVSIVGTMSAPVSKITIRGVTFTAAAYTYMAPHGVPSGGDWALQRMGAVFLEGTEGVTIDGCTFARVDGNGLFVSGYTRDAVISNNEFVWIGDSAMASWGYTRQQPHNASVYTLPKGIGIDGTDGNHPVGTLVQNNLVHEVGNVGEKQSSCWFQAKTAQTHITGLICFNGPRAGVNYNDGFGGGSVMEQSLMFNTCRESSDHGPFNSWDRQPFVTTVATGKPSLVPLPNQFKHMFLVANYGANGGCMDNDDGSSWYETYENFFVYGGHKSDFGGHSKVAHGNLNIYSQVYGPRCMMLQQLPYPGQDEGYYNNTCVLTDSTDKYFTIGGTCDPTNATAFAVKMGGNKVYTPAGDAVQAQCGSALKFSDWMSHGLDTGTTVLPPPKSADIIGWAKDLLSIE